jgi:hypothetical protein
MVIRLTGNVTSICVCRTLKNHTASSPYSVDPGSNLWTETEYLDCGSSFRLFSPFKQIPG